LSFHYLKPNQIKQMVAGFRSKIPRLKVYKIKSRTYFDIFIFFFFFGTFASYTVNNKTKAKYIDSIIQKKKKKKKKKREQKCTLCSKLYNKFETNIGVLMQLLMVKPHDKKSLRKKVNVICLRYIFYLQRIKSMLIHLYIRQKRLFTIYTISLNLREEWLCTEQRSRYRDYGIRFMLVIGR